MRTTQTQTIYKQTMPHPASDASSQHLRRQTHFFDAPEPGAGSDVITRHAPTSRLHAPRIMAACTLHYTHYHYTKFFGCFLSQLV
jgi:hypothetical protein